MLAIHTRNLTRLFRGEHGIRDLDLAVPKGAIYGFLGPNGAGKTTTIRLLLGLLVPDAGYVELFGRKLERHDPATRAGIGAMVEAPSLYPHLSGRDNVEVTRRLLGLPRTRTDAVLEIVGLRDDARRRVRGYSLGMRQRLGIALALLGEPRLLILDEPTNGLDPAGIAEIRHFIEHMTHELGLTVFLSSHLLGEVEQLATHVGVVQHGRLLFQGALDALRARADACLEIVCTDSAAACNDLLAIGETPQPVDAHTVRVTDPRHTDAAINRLLVERGHGVSRLARQQPSLEALFLQLTTTQEMAA
ncbi:MAG TPA: ABC transporter ATP-binding protein [Rhodanobacteraceae bacterium]